MSIEELIELLPKAVYITDLKIDTIYCNFSSYNRNKNDFEFNELFLRLL